MITIVGGGIGGLTLAAILQRHDIPCIVHDADLSVNSRHQGGMLNINEGPAHDALIAAGVYDAFRAKVLGGGDATRLMNRAGEVLFEDVGDGTRPEIDRGSLRTALANALPEGGVRWNSKITTVERQGETFVLKFADGHVETAEILVGADGAWSKVRPLLTAATPAYTGISFIEYRYLDSSRRWPVARRLVGNGLMFALADGRGIIAHREPADELCVYAALPVPEGHFSAEPSREEIRSAFAGWHSDFLEMLGAQRRSRHHPLALCPAGRPDLGACARRDPARGCRARDVALRRRGGQPGDDGRRRSRAGAARSSRRSRRSGSGFAGL